MRNLGESLLFALVLASLAAARPARADGRCKAPVVEAPTSEVASRLASALATHADIDTCAHLTVERTARGHDVTVVLTDGRSTTRSIAREEDILPTALALLLVPQREEPAVTEPEAPPSTVVDDLIEPDDVVEEPSPREAKAPPRRADGPPNTQARFDISLLSGARLGQNHTSVGLGLLAFLEVSSWLGGLGARVDYLQTMNASAPNATLTLSALAGRRIRLGSMALDLFGGPGVALQGTRTAVYEDPRTRRVEQTTPSALPRFLVGTRLVFRARSVVRTFLGIDGDFGASGEPDRVPFTVRPSGEEPPLLPHWSFGLAFGAGFGTP